MNCEYSYCIYNKKSACVLDTIQMDSLGMCEMCEIVTVPKENLEKYKQQHLKK